MSVIVADAVVMMSVIVADTVVMVSSVVNVLLLLMKMLGNPLVLAGVGLGRMSDHVPGGPSQNSQPAHDQSPRLTKKAVEVVLYVLDGVSQIDAEHVHGEADRDR
jgi:hypothetical protein